MTMHNEYGRGTLVPGDDEIEEYIREVLRLHHDIDNLKIFVSVLNGIVTLEGPVPIYWQKIKIEELVAPVNGVIDIKNLLTVVPTENIRDETIAADIIMALDRNYNIDASRIDIIVDNGRVILSGIVPDWKACDEAYNTVLHTIGVKDIINNLSIKG